MKRRILLLLGALLLLSALGWATYAWISVGSRPDKVGLAACCSVDRLQAQPDRYSCFQLDVRICPDSTLRVLPPSDAATPLAIDPYFQYLSQHPQSHLWMDIKNLDDDNFDLFVQQIQHLLGTYLVDRGQLILQSRRWDLLGWFTRRDVYTSYDVDLPKPSLLTSHQMDSVVTRLSRVVESGCVSALSFPSCWYGALRQQFRTSDIEFLTWRPGTGEYLFMLDPLGHLMLRDPRLRYILVED